MSVIESFEGRNSHSFYPIELCPPYLATIDKLVAFTRHNPDVIKRTRFHLFSSDHVDRFNLTPESTLLTPKNQVNFKRFQQHAKEWQNLSQIEEKSPLPIFWLFLLLTSNYEFQAVPQLWGPNSLRVVPTNRRQPKESELQKAAALQDIIFQLYAICACSLGNEYVAQDLTNPTQPCIHAPNCPVRSLGRKVNRQQG